MRQVLADLPVLFFEEKFVEKSEPEPEWGVIQTNNPVDIKWAGRIVPGADSPFFQDAAGYEFCKENVNHINKSTVKSVEFSINSG